MLTINLQNKTNIPNIDEAAQFLFLPNLKEIFQHSPCSCHMDRKMFTREGPH